MAVEMRGNHRPRSSISSFGFVEDELNILIFREYGTTSNFDTDNFKNDTRLDSYVEFSAIQAGFSKVISSRMEYIDGLQDLDPDWISGGGEVPSPSALRMAKAFLAFILHKTQTEFLTVVPKLVLGPMPIGGIEIEMHAEEDSAIYIAFNNDNSVEINAKFRGYYSTIKPPSSGISNEIFAYYESITKD